MTGHQYSNAQGFTRMIEMEVGEFLTGDRSVVKRTYYEGTLRKHGKRLDDVEGRIEGIEDDIEGTPDFEEGMDEQKKGRTNNKRLLKRLTDAC